MSPASTLETRVAVQGQRLDTHDERFKHQDDTLLRIEQKIDALKDGWNYRLIGALTAAIGGLLGVVWSYVKTTK